MPVNGFIETIGASFVKGRDFDPLNTEEKAVLINQAAAKAYGWEGREFDVKYIGRDRQGKATTAWKVVGVFSDFKPGESYDNVAPTIIFLNNRSIPEMKMLVGADGIAGNDIVPEIAGIWEEYFTDSPFDYQLVEDKLNALYWREETFMNLLMTLCVITIFITALGVIGLISFTAETRKKEIAIRKISGARLESIILLLSRQFGWLLLVATLVAVPVSIYVSKQWLANFALHIEPGTLSFMVAIPTCLAFTAVALIYHAVRAARANPVEALRYE